MRIPRPSCCRRLAAIVFLTLATSASAHPGGVDAAGGHVDKRTGLYHFHRIGGPNGVPIDKTTDLPKASSPMTSSTATPEQKRRAAREHAAEALLKASHQSKRHLEALNAVAELFPETAAGSRAKRAVERLKKKPAAGVNEVKTYTDAQLAEQAAVVRLKVARQLLALNHDELAIEILEVVIAEHPKTNAAKQASQLLEPAWPPKKVSLPESGFFDSAGK